MLLVAVMLIGMLPGTVFADEALDTSEEVVDSTLTEEASLENQTSAPAAVKDFAVNTDGFDLYSTTENGGFQVVDGKLTPSGEPGEFKAIYNGTDKPIDSVSVEIHPAGDDGLIDGGLYLNASNPADGQDKITALYVGIESTFSGWADAPNRIDPCTIVIPNAMPRIMCRTSSGLVRSLWLRLLQSRTIVLRV